MMAKRSAEARTDGEGARTPSKSPL
jgi:hypothetical protein